MGLKGAWGMTADLQTTRESICCSLKGLTLCQGEGWRRRGRGGRGGGRSRAAHADDHRLDEASHSQQKSCYRSKLLQLAMQS